MPAIGYHFVAFLTVAIWGSTFVFTKILLQHGLSPAQILTLRFITLWFLLGSLLIIIGMILSDRKTQQEHSRHQ